MKSRPYAHVAATTAALAVVGVSAAALWSGTANAAQSGTDSAYGISASGAASIGARPSVSSSNGSTRSDSGSAKSSDGTVSISSATVTAGGGKASAKVNGFTAFDGLVSASNATATCDNGKVSSSANGPASGALGKKGSIAYGVKSTNGDGSTTIVAMRVTIKAGAGTEAATINVASATCGTGHEDPKPDPKPSDTVKPTPPNGGKPKPSKPDHTTKPTTGSGNSGLGTKQAPKPNTRTTNLPVTG